MNILVLNPILFTADNNSIPKVNSIKDTLMYSMCLGYKSLGHSVTLIAASDFKPQLEEEYEFEIIFFKTKFIKICLPAVLPLLKSFHKWLKNNHCKYDLVISSEVFQFTTLSASMICPKKTIVRQELAIHQQKFHQIPSKVWHNTIVPIFMSRLKAIIPCSIPAQNFIRKYVKNVTDELVEHGINVDKFEYSLNKKPQLISSSQLIARKNISGIIDKFHKFTQIEGYDNVKLLIAGRGELREELEQQVENLKLQDRVEFLGFMSQVDLSKKVRESYMFLINTKQDNNMVSIPESIVSGTPLLTNTVPYSSEYVKHNNLEVVKDDWDEYDIKYLIDNNEQYVEQCINYRDKLTNKYIAGRLISIGLE